MITDVDVPSDKFWTEVDGTRRKHPYVMHKTVNSDSVDVVNVVSDGENHAKRWVLVAEGQHEAWVQVSNLDEYGYALQPDERVSKAELEAIKLADTG